MATENDSVVHDELFRTVERYDMEMFLKAASEYQPSVISMEEMQQLLKHQNKTTLLAKLKKLLIKDADRLTIFARFTLDYNGCINHAAHATLNHLNNQVPLPKKEFSSTRQESTRLTFSFSDPSEDSAMILPLHESSSSLGSNTPLSPMDLESYYKETDMPSQVQDESDIGYATATLSCCTCTGSLMSSTDISQSQVFKHLEVPSGNALSLQMVKKNAHSKSTIAFISESHSQPTFDEYQVTDAWLPMQAQSDSDHGYSDSLAQDVPIPQVAADGWPPQLKENYDEFLQHLNLELLVPHLLKNELLTQSECQELEYYIGVQRRKNQHLLLNVLPQKGGDTFNIFMKCLKAEKEHLGHRYLVEKFWDKRRRY